jgi:N-acetylneuraminic acid mutarotase
MVFDVSQNTWRSSDDGLPGAPPPLPEARHSGAAASWGGKIYLLGGQQADGSLPQSVLCLDPAAATPTWEVITELPTPRALLAVVTHEGRLIAMGGKGADGLPLTTVEVYDL